MKDPIGVQLVRMVFYSGEPVMSLLWFLVLASCQKHILVFRRARGQLIFTLGFSHVINFVGTLLFPLLLDLFIELFVTGFAYLQILATTAKLGKVEVKIKLGYWLSNCCQFGVFSHDSLSISVIEVAD